MMRRKRAKQTAADSGMRAVTPAPVTHSEQRRSLDHNYCAFPRRSPLECSSLESWLPGLGYGVRRKPVVDIPLCSLTKWRDVRVISFVTSPEETEDVTKSPLHNNRNHYYNDYLESTETGKIMIFKIFNLSVIEMNPLSPIVYCRIKRL